MKPITSRENAHYKALKKLCLSGRERRKTGRAVLDGMHLIESYVQRFGAPEEIIVSESGALRVEIDTFLRGANSGNTIFVLNDALFDDLSLLETPSGILALVFQPRPHNGLNLTIDTVILDGVQDPGNVGSILRSAAATGFRQILLSADCAQAWSPKTLRSAMGAHFQIDIHESCDFPAFLASYCGQAVLTALDASVDLYSLELKGPVAWVFGSEGQGIRPSVANTEHLRIRIPMPGPTESLNVAAAAAVCLFETIRQRR
ncbi:RNA methyltransferase [Propionivibrio sp.]|uniref:TrmH family RNA methyltransferase n=1 Tax=Propionivibrio sp. TaxID=2212460 RepID=UPI0025D2AE3C|nr:RNA methyltransferase [Propionivibrio sp.]MBK7356519.1 RNA methyltransferase [Propionivibrio sp.]MBK8400932.1 RNA methyltransferase [Propionivibrio sp.]MBK8745276.1 RNA methyltransferase [Propionivibrio sp.]MBK8894217.1 RNA methyltransferase [Propionivibrio sp.]MBL0207658.1 RNA methyltransferase [Propionivibrio sp.]